ncbi:MAG TPA: prolipoprotein diacylglyceryl transferase [Candidatus Rifleibacterium sp.]|nr:prolipoprotein diacylglyceryl transferase [Candidatus Rifleibacterium sp.]
MELGNIYISLANLVFLLSVTRSHSRMNLSREEALSLALLMLFAGVAGARLFYALINGISLNQAFDLFSAHRGGFSILGAVVAAFLTLIIFSTVNKKSVTAVAGEIVPAWCLASIFWRMRCHFNGCCHGATIASPFISSLAGFTCAGAPGQMPLPLFEMLFLLLLLVWLTAGIAFLARKTGCSEEKCHRLRILSYFSAYGIFRLLTPH